MKKVTRVIARTLDQPADQRRMTVDGIDVEIDDNGCRSQPPSDDFLDWPLCVELEAVQGDTDALVRVTKLLFAALWDAGVPTVAACDFEDELPWRAGLDRIPPH